MIELKKFDAADYLDNPSQISAYLIEAVETGNTMYMKQAIRTVERALAKWLPPSP